MNDESLQRYFQKLGHSLFQNLHSNEAITLSFEGEKTRYLRFNKSKVRQSSDVQQWQIAMKYQLQAKGLDLSFQLGSDEDEALETLKEGLKFAREEVKCLPDDPFQTPIENYGKSINQHKNNIPDSQQLLDEIQSHMANTDLSGIAALGPLYRGLMNSEGMEHWFETHNFDFDYSLYNAQKAVKNIFAPKNWHVDDFARQLDEDKTLLGLMDRPKRKLSPGKYRCYLGPQAISDIVVMLGRGLSYAQNQRGASPLYKLWKKEKKLSPLVNLEENFTAGHVPQFNSEGELCAEKLGLIESGEIKTLLTSRRSELEYAAKSNQASSHEFPRSLYLRPGELKEAEALKRLGTGLFISNLHYLNWSDVPNARLTGMTRFACFWVEGGEIQGPIQDMRFDETLFACLGENLEALTQSSPFHPEISTYFNRSLGGLHAPGALINDFKLTL